VTYAEKMALRSKHTCVLRNESRSCTACNRGVPYPALTVDEIIESLAAGRREAKAAEPALAAPSRRRR
jgi:hypothetical protein